MELKKFVTIVCLFFLIQGVAMAETQTFVDEVKAVRKKSKTANIEIHGLAAKYVPVGTHEDVALEFCKANGFKIYPPTDKEEVLLCSLDMTKWYLLGFGDEVRIIMRIKDNIVVSVKGFIFYQAL